MKSSAMLINLARGGVVNEHDLHLALRQKTIAAAAVDVLSTEPPTKDQPLLIEPLDNLIVTPHIGWASRQARQELIHQIVEIFKAFLENRQINSV